MSSCLFAPMTKDFVRRIAACEGVDWIRFLKGQRKDDVAHEYLGRFEGDECVLFIGKAQEKAATA